jgi:putative N6-adenine-specific DNA methylase
MLREARKTAFVPDRGARPRVEQVLQVRIVDDQATLSLDAGGELLHRRGWRTEAGRAPMRENLAACLLALAEWDGTDALYDPCCGSGTILIEGALLAAGRPPFAGRNFACDEWPPAAPPRGAKRPAQPGPPAGRARLPGRAAAPVAPPAAPANRVVIAGSDHHGPTVQVALQNARRAGVRIDVRPLELDDIQPPAVVGTVVSNLPWGERLGERVGGVYTAFGRVLRERFQSWRVVFVTSDNRLARRVDERVECLVRFKNGGIPVGVWTFLA